MNGHNNDVRYLQCSLELQSHEFRGAQKAITIIPSCLKLQHIIPSNNNTDETKPFSSPKQKFKEYQFPSTVELYWAMKYAERYITYIDYNFNQF